MTVTSADLWKLLKQSRLLSAGQLEQVRIAFDQTGSRTQRRPAKTLARWLLRQRLLTKYQAGVLLSGRAGPFMYGDYQVQDRIRSGRLGGTFQAIHLPSGYPVLIRFVESRVAQDPRQWRVARQHVHAVSPIIHPQLQRVFALEDLSGYRFLVLGLPTGTSLELRLKVAQQLPAPQACQIARQVALGLDELHERRQIYGDVRPWNIWVDSHNDAILLRDRAQPPRVPELSQPGLLPAQAAQADYLAPELAHPGTPLSPATDIYALGCTLYELLAGSPPRAGRDACGRPEQKASAPMQVPRLPAIGDELAHLITQMLAENPGERILSAAAIADQLARFAPLSPPSFSVHPAASALQAFEETLADTRCLPPAPPPLFPEPDDHPPIAAPPIQRVVATHMPPADTAEEPATLAAPTPSPPPLAVNAASVPRRQRSANRLRRARQARRKQAMWLSVIAAGVLILASGTALLNPRLRQALHIHRLGTTQIEQTPRQSIGNNKKTALTTTPDATATSPASRYDVRRDDGQLPWMTPTTGSPLQLHHLPPGAQLLLVARPHDLLSAESGEQVARALGPSLAAAQETWEVATGLPIEQIAQLTLTWHDAEPIPQPFLQARLHEPLTADQLLSAWGNPSRTDYRDHHYYLARGWAFFIPGSEPFTEFVMGNESQIRDVIDLSATPVLVRRELAQLLQGSDSDRHLSLLWTPDFLTEKLLSAPPDDSSLQRRRLREAANWLFGEDIKACLLSLHFTDPFYLELRAAGQVKLDSPAIAESLRGRMAEVPDRMELFFNQVYPSVYWRRIALRLPAMIRFLHQYTRVSVEDDQAIINAVLPPQAAHNLAFAAQMLLYADSDETEEIDASAAAPRVPQTIEELLDTPIDLRFDQQSLEFAMRDLLTAVRESYPSLPFPFDIQIAGTDLQLNGITRNQQIPDFHVEESTLGEVLTALVLRANPVTTVTDPADPQQKLVWVVGPDRSDPKNQVLLITTRDAAQRNGYKLPSSFLPK